jgi:NADH-quinone oxidoreductase subunit L
MSSWLILLTIGLPWLGALVLWFIPEDQKRWQHILAVIFSVAAGLSGLALLTDTSDTPAISIPLGSVFGDFTFVPDGLGVFIAVIATVVGSLAVIFSVDYMAHHDEQLRRYYILVLLFIGTMAGLALAGNLLLMFLLWEVTALCSYALISFHNDDPKAVAGGIKALIITQIGGVGLLVGALICYAYLGTYQINQILAEAHSLPAGVLGALAFGFLIAAAAKSAQVPLHTWLPDAMEAPTPISALIHAATMVNAGVYLLARFYPAFENVPGWTTTVILVGALSALFAGVMALVANDLKRALAYSTVSQLGYMVYGVGSSAIFASQFHLLSHAVFKALLFLSAGAVITAVGTRDMQKMGGLGKQMPFVRAVFIIGALALIGLPITNGFFSKELLLEGGLYFGPTWAYVIMLIGAGITAIYTLRMVSMVFFGERRGAAPEHDGLPAMRISLGLLAFGTLTTWLLAGPLSHILAATLPYHEIYAISTLEMVEEVLLAPATWGTLLLIVLSAGLWFLRGRLNGLIQVLQPLADFAARGLGFEWLNEQIVRLTVGVASIFRRTQTGQLNWNIAGIVGAVVVVLIWLIF